MTATMPLPTSGVLDGKFHLFPIRVYYGETDAGQMVYHAAYLNFAERARTEMMRMAGIDHVSLFSDDGLMFTVHSADIRYLEQARLDDELVIRTHVVSSGGASMTISQHVFRIVQETMGDIRMTFKHMWPTRGGGWSFGPCALAYRAAMSISTPSARASCA